MYMHACMHVCMYVCMYLCMYLHKYIYIYIYLFIGMNATCMYVTFFSASIVLDLLLNYFDGVSHSKKQNWGYIPASQEPPDICDQTHGYTRLLILFVQWSIHPHMYSIEYSPLPAINRF